MVAKERRDYKRDKDRVGEPNKSGGSAGEDKGKEEAMMAVERKDDEGKEDGGDRNYSKRIYGVAREKAAKKKARITWRGG